jgi:hypothetical protein
MRHAPELAIVGYCGPWVRSLIHSPDAVAHSPAGITAACPITRDQFAVAARLDPQNTEAVLLIVVRDAARHHETGQHLHLDDRHRRPRCEEGLQPTGPGEVDW